MESHGRALNRAMLGVVNDAADGTENGGLGDPGDQRRRRNCQHDFANHGLFLRSYRVEQRDAHGTTFCSEPNASKFAQELLPRRIHCESV